MRHGSKRWFGWDRVWLGRSVNVADPRSIDTPYMGAFAGLIKGGGGGRQKLAEKFGD